MDALEKVELTVPIRHIARFLKSGIPKSQIWLAEKEEEEEEQRLLQSILRFTQTQQY